MYYFYQISVKSTAGVVPNFENLHNRMFEKAESIVENRNRHDQRAMQLMSGKKPTEIPSKINTILLRIC